MIYVTVGTMFMDFPRLICKMDAIARETGEDVTIQIGMGPTKPEHADFFDFKSRDEVLAIQQQARLIVTHAGIGSVIDALHAKRPFIVVPRLRRHDEHMNDHQLDLARAVDDRGWGRMVLEIDDLDEACANPRPFPTSYRPAKTPLIHSIRGVIESVAAKKAARQQAM